MVLLQNCHSFPGGDEYRALIGFQLPCKNFQKCGLTGTIGTNQSVTVALCEIDIHIVEKYSAAILEADTLCSDHVFLSFFSFHFLLRYGTFAAMFKKQTKFDYNMNIIQNKSPISHKIH